VSHLTTTDATVPDVESVHLAELLDPSRTAEPAAPSESTTKEVRS
jgi:hypothetical protein